MNWHEYLLTLRRNADSKVFRIVACALVFFCSVAIIAVCVWEGSFFASKNGDHTATLSRKPRSRILYSHTLSMSIDENLDADLDESFCDEDSWSGFLPRNEDEAMSLAVAGRMCFPSAVSMALLQMLDDPVNDRLDTMLHVACQAGDLVTICFLIDAGADMTVTNRFGETPLDLVDRGKREYLEGITRIIEDRRPHSVDCSDSATHRG